MACHADTLAHSERARILGAAERAARAAGRRIADMRSTAAVDVNFKAPRNLVTPADLEAEGIIARILREEFPQWEILSEESLASHRHDLTAPLWIVDPIDGTTNYAHGHHMAAVSIAFACGGAVQAAVVHCPFLEETFTALRGSGARLNGQTIRCSAAARLEDSLVATGFPAERDTLPSLTARLGRVLARCRDIRRLGAASLDIAWVAAGRLDAYYETVNVWDMAAACLIAREAGARTGQFKETPGQNHLPPELRPQNLLVANPVLFEQFCGILRD